MTQASANGDLELLECVFEHFREGVIVDVESSRLHHSALTWASFCGHADLAVVLLQHGADLFRRTNTEGKTPLMHAAANGQHTIVRGYIQRYRDHVTKDRALQFEYTGVRYLE